MKIFRGAGFLIVFFISACSISPVNVEESLITTELSTPTENVGPQSSSTQATLTPGSPEPALDSTPQIPLPSAECPDISGSINPYEIKWKDESLIGRIYTPPCYRENPQEKYPTLYLLHGATVNDQQWENLGVGEIADRLITQGEISPLIIIMPREITWIVLPDNLFGDQLIKVLIPWVDSEYQTLADRQYRAIGGLSRGGNWAVRLGLLHWGLFGSIGGHSTPLFIGDLSRVEAWIEFIPENKTPRIYLDIGEGDNNLEEAEQFRDKLVSFDISHEWQIFPGLHEESYWKSHLEDYLLWYSAGWGDNPHLSN